MRICLRLAWELVLPAVLLIAPILDTYKPWRSLLQNFHDLTSWVLAILVILLITGIIRAGFPLLLVPSLWVICMLIPFELGYLLYQGKDAVVLLVPLLLLYR